VYQGELAQNIPLKNGDVVYVPRSTIGDIKEFIINTTPLLNYLLIPGDYRDAYFHRLQFALLDQGTSSLWSNTILTSGNTGGS